MDEDLSEEEPAHGGEEGRLPEQGNAGEPHPEEGEPTDAPEPGDQSARPPPSVGKQGPTSFVDEPRVQGEQAAAEREPEGHIRGATRNGDHSAERKHGPEET
ncbi:hypothetical protein DRQ29_05360 [bacterium]|nr:MAG: hypothetical protein DRQ29_05360 [bacterium]